MGFEEDFYTLNDNRETAATHAAAGIRAEHAAVHLASKAVEFVQALEDSALRKAFKQFADTPSTKAAFSKAQEVLGEISTELEAKAAAMEARAIGFRRSSQGMWADLHDY